MEPLPVMMTPATLVRPKAIYFTMEGHKDLPALIMQNLSTLYLRLKIEDIRILQMPDGKASCKLVSKHQVTFSTTRRGSTSWKNVIDPIFCVNLLEEEVLHQKKVHTQLEGQAPVIFAVIPSPSPLPSSASPSPLSRSAPSRRPSLRLCCSSTRRSRPRQPPRSSPRTAPSRWTASAGARRR